MTATSEVSKCDHDAQATDEITRQERCVLCTLPELDRVLFGHVSEETAYVVEDYPYGFRLRTSIRYWIETTKNGDRMVSQTLNPKTDRWNKPKKSTYLAVGVLFLDEQDHVTWTGLHEWTSGEFPQARAGAFRDRFADHLTTAQRAKLAAVIGLNRAMEGFSCTIVTNPSPEESERIKKNNDAVNTQLARRASVETFHAKNEIIRDHGFAPSGGAA